MLSWLTGPLPVERRVRGIGTDENWTGNDSPNTTWIPSFKRNGSVRDVTILMFFPSCKKSDMGRSDKWDFILSKASLSYTNQMPDEFATESVIKSKSFFMHTWKIFIQSLALAGLHRGSCSVIIGAFKVLLIMLAHTANASLLMEIARLTKPHGWSISQKKETRPYITIKVTLRL